jgi:hypothetical protein
MRILSIILLCGLAAIMAVPAAWADTGTVPSYVKGFSFTSTHYNEYRSCGYGPPVISGGPFYGPPISTSYVQTPVIHEKVVVNEVVAPVAVPVVVPATVFQYLPAMAPQAPSAPAVIGTGGTVASAQAAPTVQVPGSMPPTAGVASAAQPVTPAAPVAAGLEAKLDLLIKARLDAIVREKMAAAADAPPPLADQDAATQPTNYSTPPPADTTNQQTSTTSDKPAPYQVAPPVSQAPAMADLQTRAMTAVGNACVSCHKQGAEKGGVILVNAQNQWAPSKDGAQLPNETIARSVENGRMPKLNATLHNQPLEPVVKNDLLAWLRKQ